MARTTLAPNPRGDMQGFVTVTDYDWFQFLSKQGELDEVNFWRPSDTRTPQALVPGTPIIFKLRKRHGGWIVGFGVFARHAVLPVWLAWESFGVKNGAATLAEVRARILALVSGGPRREADSTDHLIGCLMLSQPVFFPRERWIEPPRDWSENVVQGKGYDLESGEGARIWEACRAVAVAYPSIGLVSGADKHREPSPRYGEGVLVKPRLGQGIFRVAVTDAYGKSCAVTSEHSLPALEAAHIRPYGEGGEHEITNGLLLRSDIHRLFDRGYVGVTPDYRFVVSDRLRDDYSNGRSYYPLHGQAIVPPANVAEQPSRELLRWHLESKFRG